MNLDDLLAIAKFHRHTAENARKMAAGMGNCPVATGALRNAELHDDWADKLIELADAFRTFGHKIASNDQ